MEPQDFEQTYEVWPENWPVWLLYMQLSNQWRMAAGATGGYPYALDYNALFPLLERQRLNDQEWQRMFDDIRAIEGAAFETLHKKP